MKIAFTGHRPDKLPNKQIGYSKNNPLKIKIQDKIEEYLSQYKELTCITGMTLGIDQWAAEVCINLNMPFIAAVPFNNQEILWPKDSQEHYLYLLSKAKEIKIISSGSYAAWKMQVRNKWMVDNSDLLIAVFDGSSGGTKNCIDYAISQNKKIIYKNPKELI